MQNKIRAHSGNGAALSDYCPRRKLAEDKSAGEDWVYVNRPDEDEEAFIREMEADAAEAEAAIEIEPEADQMLLTGGEGNE